LQANQIGESIASNGGQFRAFIPSGASTTTIKIGIGRVCRLGITTPGTGVLTIFDSTTASGNVLYSSATSQTNGVYDIQLPAEVGLTVQNTVSGPVAVVSFN
jgi:hypothetical protein